MARSFPSQNHLRQPAVDFATIGRVGEPMDNVCVEGTKI